jgi:hypothetical protein
MSASAMLRGSLSFRSSSDQRKESAVAFLEAAIDYFASLGIRVEGVMTDNGSCYRSKAFRAACKRLGLRPIFTKPYRALPLIFWSTLIMAAVWLVGQCNVFIRYRPVSIAAGLHKL